MTREVSFLSSLPSGDTINVVLCDKYMHSLAKEVVQITVGTKVVLNVNEDDTCWVADLPDKKVPFWIYKSDTVEQTLQTVDLEKDIFKQHTLPNMEYADIYTAGMNAKRSINMLGCGEVTVGGEEQSFLCRYDAFAAGDEDVLMCEIDTIIGEN